MSEIGRAHVILVHGTWGHGNLHSVLWDFLPLRRRQKEIDWPVGTALAEAGATIHSFNWSGKNSHRRRREAGKQLAAFIRSLSKGGSDRVWIVAHSHGGNVALYALKNLRREDVDGIVCLATPFLQFSPQQFDFGILRWLPFVFGIIVYGLVLVLLAALLESVMELDPELPASLWIIVGVSIVAGFLAGRALRDLLSRIDLFRSHIPKLCESYQPPPPERRLQFLILRKVGDEASAALGTGLFLEWLLSLVWKSLSLYIAALDRVLSLFKLIPGKSRWRKAMITLMIVLIMMYVVFYLLLMILGPRTVVNLITNQLSVLAPWAFVLAIFFIFLAQVILFITILALNLLRFGFATQLGATSLIRVTAEATPQGSWEVELFPGRGFAHSEIYKDPCVARRLADRLFVKE